MTVEQINSELPPEILEKIEIVESDPVNIYMEDLDTEILGRSNSEAVSLALANYLRWLRMSMIFDKFKTHRERRTWRTQLEETYGEDSPELKIFKNNKLGINAISRLYSWLRPITQCDKQNLLFSETEKQDIEKRMLKAIRELDAIYQISVEHPSENRSIILSKIKEIEEICYEIIDKFLDHEMQMQRVGLEEKLGLIEADDSDLQRRGFSIFDILEGGIDMVTSTISGFHKAIQRLLARGRKKE